MPRGEVVGGFQDPGNDGGGGGDGGGGDERPPKPPPIPGVTWVWDGTSWVPNVGGGGGGGTTSESGSSGGGSSGGSSGGGGGGTSEAEQRVQSMASAYERKYFELWGVLPPPGYAERFVKAGLNIWEFEENERKKPAFRRTETYKGEAEQFAKMLESMGI